MKGDAGNIRGYPTIEVKFESKLKRITSKYATKMFSDISGPAENIYSVVAIYAIAHIIFCSVQRVNLKQE